MRRFLPALAVLSLFVAPAVRAEPGQPLLVVMDFEAKGASKLEAEAATQNVARGLRQLEVFQVLTSGDVRQLLAIERDKQLMGVESDQGITELGKSLGARHWAVGTVTRTGKDLLVELRLLDTQDGKVVNQKQAGPAPGMEGLATTLLGLAQELVSPLLKAQQGTLWVGTREEGAEVLVDDVLVASTPMKSPLPLSRGTHRLQVRKDGFIAQSLSVKIQPDQLSRQELALLPSPDYADAHQQRHGRLRTGAWIATAVAAGALGSALYLDRTVTAPTYRDEFVPRQLALAQLELTPEVRDNPTRYGLWRACGANEEACRTTTDQLKSKLMLSYGATLGLAVVGLASAGASSYLWLTGEDPNRYARLVASIQVGESRGLVFSGQF